VGAPGLYYNAPSTAFLLERIAIKEESLVDYNQDYGVEG